MTHQQLREELKGLMFLYDNKISMADRSNEKIALKAQAGKWFIEALESKVQEYVNSQEPTNEVTKVSAKYIRGKVSEDKCFYCGATKPGKCKGSHE